MSARSLLTLAAAIAAAGCGDNLSVAPERDGAPPDGAAAPADAAVADAPPPDAASLLTLAETGLYASFPDEISPDVTEYEVRFELWSDGASKRRWVQLPPGSPIDSSDMDYWIYPEGTRIWKEFSRGGLRIETRLIEKVGPDPGDWDASTFVWNLAQDEAVAESDGIKDALGTGHDVPRLFACRSCHDRQPDFVLGYSAIQLDGSGEGHGLDDLIAAGALSDPPAGDEPTLFPLPGGPVDQAALGYLHGNCGGCHNPRKGVTQVPIDLRLEVAAMDAVADTATFQSTVGIEPMLSVAGATSLIEPGAPESSAVHIRMGSLTPGVRMPEVGSEELDDDGLAAVGAWIDSMP
jgi:hypothetical protein